MKNKKLSPIECKTNKQIHSLSDESGIFKDFIMYIDDSNIRIYQHKPGESYKQGIDIPKKHFDKLLEWYTKPQVIK